MKTAGYLIRIFYGLIWFAVLYPVSVLSQEKGSSFPDGTDGLQHSVHEKDTTTKNLPPNEFIGSVSSCKIGMGYIHDFSAYVQSEVFEQQMDSAGLDLKSRTKLRDFRILGSGVLKTKRYIAWKFAYMWDGDNEQWLVRESGITIGVPELAGHLFIGRTKEGYSMVKVMNGHSPWTSERQMAADVIPILADGIKLFGYLEKPGIFWNIGAYNDFMSKGQGFSTFSSQYVARIGWLPVRRDLSNKVLHIAGNFQYGKPLDGKITLKSRPESNPAPQILNTGSFDADYSIHLGTEIYYRNKRFMAGSEINTHHFYSDKSGGNHHFYGGDIVLSYFFTKAIRPYNTVGNIFGFIPIKKPVTKGGWGESEAVVRFSLINLDDGSVQGGKFWRLTPMINWYLTKVIRMEFIYGYGMLDRFNLSGVVQIFEGRIQFTLM